MVRRTFTGRFAVALVAASIVTSAGLAPGGSASASACLSKVLGKKESASAKVVGELPKRNTSAQDVELVAGNPPALYWKTEASKPKGVVLCLHELGMHAGRFEDLGKRMSSDGYAVYATDFRGFGAWRRVAGKDARMDIDRSLEDTRLTLEAIRKSNPGLPVFLLGEAMGGAMALKVAAQYPNLVQGVVSSAPGGEHYKTVGNYMQVGARVLVGRHNKDANMAEDLIVMATPRNSLQQNIKSDPWVRMDLTPRELMSCQFFMYKTRSFARKIKERPVMIVQGMKDGESRPEGADKISNVLTTKNKEMLKVPEGDHFVYQDSTVDDAVVKQTLGFLDKHGTATY